MLSGAIAQALDDLTANRGRPRRMLLAVSGGSDSLALLLTAASSAADLQWPDIHVATVDHGLRPEAAGEARSVAALCAELGLPHRTLRWNGARREGGNLQAAARDARYRLLAVEARRVGAAAILTAHHRDDQIETHLLARRRGAQGAVLAGMRIWRDLEPGLFLLRPFLSASRAELRETVSSAGIQAIEDPSNSDVRFARVALRRELALEGGDSAGVLDDIRAANLVRQDADRSTVRILTALTVGSTLVAGDDGAVRLCEWSDGIDQRVLARVVTAVGGGHHPPESAKVERLAKALSESSQVVQTLGGCRVERCGRDLHVLREFGRAGPATVPLVGNDRSILFDNRFDISLVADDDDDDAAHACIEPFGRLGRGGTHRRTLPVQVDAHGNVTAAHPALAMSLPGVAALATRSRIGWRIWANLPGLPPRALTHRLQNAANATEPVGKDLEATYLR